MNALRLIAHALGLAVETARYGLSSRQFSLVAFVTIGVLLAALVFAVQVVAPLALYPFA